MTSIPPERFYQLLPAVYRARDVAQGEPLRALLGVLQSELDVLAYDIDALYDNWFIETCAPWVVPYIGDLVGTDPLAAVVPNTDNARAYVANTVAYHRRKGTAGALSSLARDLSGWPARAIELYQLVGTTQPINHPLPANLRTPSLRQKAILREIGGPFEVTAHAADLRRVGKYALRNVGVFVWRLTSYPVRTVQPKAGPAAASYWFNPLGTDTQLWSPLRTLSGTGAAVGAGSVPAPLARGPLSGALEAARQALANGQPAPVDPYFDLQPSFQISVQPTPGAAFVGVPPEQILIADLSAWPASPQSETIGSKSLPIMATVDPQLGRLVLASPAHDVRVSYFYGFSSEVGGGFYDRSLTISETPTPRQISGGGALVLPSGLPAQAIVEITDSLVYVPPAIVVPDGATLELRGANKQRPLLSSTSSWSIALGVGSTLTLSGLLIDADLMVTAASPGATLSMVHTTLVPGHAVGSKGALTLTLERCITGALLLDPSRSTVRVDASIVDVAGMPGPALQAGRGTLTSSTVLGQTAMGQKLLGQTTPSQVISATDTLFTDLVTVTGTGTLTTCFVPQGSPAPPGIDCQPALALSQAPPDEAAAIVGRLRPSFTSTQYGAPGYAQLRHTSPIEIRQGGSDQSEMGVFHDLYQARRETNLEAGLRAYLRVGLSATVFFVT